MVLGGLTAMLFRTSHSAMSMGLFLRKVDLRSMFFATVFLIVLLVLAYLTNPSETSFRTYLTEQSFRQHLSRLDENVQDEHADREDSGVHYSLARRTHPAPHKPGRDFNNTPPFRFVKRASVSLRTPKHIFRSFGILTIAAVSPSSHSQPHVLRNEGLGPLVSDSWFIGIFGKWWRGGAIPPWCNDTLDHIKDTERCSSGILDLKALDGLEGYDGLPFSASSLATLCSPPNGQDASAKSRASERSAQRTTNSAPRSTTPPPLPKSASLPLHAPRVPVASSPKGERSASHRITPAPSQSQAPVSADHSTPHPAAFTPPSTSYFDQSPVIAEILRQISQSNVAVHDLRTQLSDFRTASSDAHAAIQGDLDAHRERKRAEDASRLELKTRTKTLEDQKRAAESGKRDVEKRLKAAEGARDSASQRIERLDKEISALRERMQQDAQAAARAAEEGDAAEREITQQVELKKKEISVAEDVIAALNARAKELEERIVEEEKRLQRAREQAELRKQDRSFFPLHVVSTVSDDAPGPWSPIAPYDQTYSQDPHTHISTDMSEHIDVLPPSLQVQVPPSRRSSGSGEHRDISISPRPRHLSLAGISNFRERVHPSVSEESGAQVFLRPQAFPIQISSAQSHSTRFSPFSDNDIDGVLSPRSSQLIPTSLINSLEGAGSGVDELARSFQTEGDAVVPPNWRKLQPPPIPIQVPAVFSTSPTSIACPSFDAIDKEDPFEVRPPPPPLRHRLTADAMDMQRALFPAPGRTTSDPPPLTRVRSHEERDDKAGAAHRRWFSADPKDKDKDKEKKGLNPEAKVFRLTNKSLPSALVTPPPRAFDPLAPHAASTLSLPGMLAPPPAPEPSTLFSSLSMRAFAPSPAEREALQRALGGSSSGSLERLPTLSEVSIASMPPSPSHVQAIAAAHTHQHPHPHSHQPGARTLLPQGLSWLQLPRMRKSKFSPWEDADEVQTGAGRRAGQ